MLEARHIIKAIHLLGMSGPITAEQLETIIVSAEVLSKQEQEPEE